MNIFLLISKGWSSPTTAGRYFDGESSAVGFCFDCSLAGEVFDTINCMFGSTELAETKEEKSTRSVSALCVFGLLLLMGHFPSEFHNLPKLCGSTLETPFLSVLRRSPCGLGWLSGI